MAKEENKEGHYSFEGEGKNVKAKGNPRNTWFIAIWKWPPAKARAEVSWELCQIDPQDNRHCKEKAPLMGKAL